MPKRFQITRLLMPNPPNAKRVMRPSRWGKPFPIEAAGSAAAAVARFRQHLADHPELVELGWRELGLTLAAPVRSESPAMPMAGWRW